MKNKNIFNKVSHQFLAIFLTAILLLTNISTSVIYAQDDEQPVESPETTQVVDTDETKQTSGGEKEASTPTPEVGEKTKTEEAPDGTNEVSVSEKLTQLINQLPTIEEYQNILSSDNTEAYENLESLLEQIETLADENDIDLSQYEKYTSLFSNNDVNTLDVSSLTVSWESSGGSTLEKMEFNTDYSVSIAVDFPEKSSERVLTVEPKVSMTITDDFSSNKDFTNGVSISNLGTTVTANPATGSGVSMTFSNLGRKYEFNDIVSSSYSIKIANSHTRSIFSNGASGTNLSDCVKVTMSYKDGENNPQSITKTLSVGEVEKIKPQLKFYSNYYTESAPRAVLQGDKNIPTTNDARYNALFSVIYEKTSNTVLPYMPIKSATLVVQVSKGLYDSSSDSFNIDWDGWTYDSKIDNNDGTYNVTLHYGNGNFTAYRIGDERCVGLNFTPKVNIPSNATDKTKYIIHVVSCDIYQYENYTLDKSGTTATGEEKLYQFNKDGGYGTAYYEVVEAKNPFVVGYTTDGAYDLKTNSAEATLGDIGWYNSSYPKFEGIVTNLAYGNYGTIDITNVNYTLQLKFDSTNIGVRALYIPMSAEQYDEVKAAGSYTIKVKTTKNQTLHEVTLSNINGGPSGDWANVYFDSETLGLSEGEYLTEVRYKINRINASYTKQEKDKVCYDNRNNFIFSRVIGVILNSTNGTEYTNTIQMFSDENCSEDKAVTTLGKVTSVINGEKRVNIYPEAVSAKVNGVSASTISAGDTVTISETATGLNSSDGFNSTTMGYAPLKAIYIRDLFGNGISNLNVKNNYNNYYLVENGKAKNGVSVTLDHTEVAQSGTDYNINVYKVSFDGSQVENNNHVIGAYYSTITDAKGNVSGASITVSFDVTVPDNFEEVDNTTELPIHLNDKFETKYTIYWETDNGYNPSITNVNMQYHNNYTANGQGYYYHIDEFDVNKDGKTAFAHPVWQYNYEPQGDPLITRTNSGPALQMEQPELKSDLEVTGWFKESYEGNSAYRSFDANQAEQSSVNLAASDATIRLLIANYGNKAVTNFDFYIPIPKEGENWGKYSNNEDFKFTVNLTSEMTNPYVGLDGYTFKVTYGKITPTDNGDTLDASSFENFNASKASSYNCIKIHADSVPAGQEGETAVDQLARTKYFTADVEYGGDEIPTETLYDIYKGPLHYTKQIDIQGHTLTQWWYDYSPDFGLRAVEKYTADALDKYVSNSKTYNVSSTNEATYPVDAQFDGVATITTTKAIVIGKSVSAKLDITSPNFTLDKDGVFVTVTDDNGNVKTYNYTDDNSKVKIVKAGETSGTTTGSKKLLKLNFDNKFNKLNTGVVVLNEPDTKTVYESYTITIDGSVVNGNVHFDTPIVGKVGSITGVNGGTETGNTGEGEANTKVKLPINDTDGLTTKVYTSDVKAENGKILPSTPEQVASNVSVKIGGVTLTGVIMETPDVSKLNPGEFIYTPTKDSSGDYTNASVTIPSLSLLDTISYPNLNVEIVVTALEKPTPNNPSSSSPKGEHHVTCEEYMKSNDWTWSEASQKCVIKAKVSDGYVVPNTADKSN